MSKGATDSTGKSGGVVVSGESDTRLHNIGEFRGSRIEFTTPTRSQTQQPNLRYRNRTLTREDVTVRHGLSVTTAERTIAESGVPFKGGPRPFGYEDDRVTIRESEAVVIREVTERVIAGETLYSIARDLEARGVTTVGGNAWTGATLRNFLLAPRYWGMRVHNGQVIGEAAWPGIITAEQAERVGVILNDPARRTNRSARRYLLSGMLRCGVCGSPLYSTPKDGKRRYGCMPAPNRPNCGRVFIYAEKLEAFISEAVLVRLDSPDLFRLSDSAEPAPDLVALAASIESATARLDDLAAMWAEGEISRPEWVKARGVIQERLEADRRAYARARDHDGLTRFAGKSAQLRDQWATMPLTRQVAVVKSVIDHVSIASSLKPGRAGLDVDRITISWRL